MWWSCWLLLVRTARSCAVHALHAGSPGGLAGATGLPGTARTTQQPGPPDEAERGPSSLRRHPLEPNGRKEFEFAAGVGAWLRRVHHEAEVRVLGVEDVGVHGDVSDIRVLDEFVRTLVTAHRSEAPQLAEPWAEVQPRYQCREV